MPTSHEQQPGDPTPIGPYPAAVRTPRDLDPDDGTVWDLPRDAEYDDPDDPASGYRDDEG